MSAAIDNRRTLKFALHSRVLVLIVSTLTPIPHRLDSHPHSSRLDLKTFKTNLVTPVTTVLQ